MPERDWPRELCQRATPEPYWLQRARKWEEMFTQTFGTADVEKVATIVQGVMETNERLQEKTKKLEQQVRELKSELEAESEKYWQCAALVQVLEQKIEKLEAVVEAAREALRISPEFNEDVDRLVKLRKVLEGVT